MNEGINSEIKRSRINKYEIAEKLGLHEFSFSRWFRKPLTEEQIEQIREAIKKIKAEDEKNALN